MAAPASSSPKYSVVIPVLNEIESLPELYERLVAVLDCLDGEYEVLFVDDGSSDGSIEWLKAKTRENPRVRLVIFLRNFGQQAASLAGFANVRGEIILTLDADLQNPPEAFPKLIAALEDSGVDMVTGWRQSRHDYIWRTWPSKFFNALTSYVTEVKLHDYGTNLRVYRRHVTDQLVNLGSASIHLSALVSWLGFQIKEVPVDHMPRKAGVSRYNFYKLYRATMDMLTSYSVLPIQVMSLAGFLTAGIGFLFGARLLVMRLLFGRHPAELQTTVALIFFFFGVIMVFLGVLGEYLGRMFVLIKKHPFYIIREEVSAFADQSSEE